MLGVSHRGTKNKRPAGSKVNTGRGNTYLDLCGWDLFPGSSNVHGEFEVRHDWQGWPSSHFILLRLWEGEISVLCEREVRRAELS